MRSKHRRSRILVPKKSKIAFVCSGGAAKAAAFHIGVALALQEKGFRFVGGLKKDAADPALEMSDGSGRNISVYVGSSAGSILCSFLAAGYTIDQIFDSFLRKPQAAGAMGRPLKRLTYPIMFTIRKDMGWVRTLGILGEGAKLPNLGRFVQGLVQDSYETLFKWSWLRWPGLFSTSGIERYLREDVLPANEFAAFQADLFIVATQLNHSKKVVFGKYDALTPTEDRSCVYSNAVSISQAAAASTALPPIFAPYPIINEKGQSVYYFDGEIRETLSTHVGYDAGADLVFASYSHQPYHFSREVGSLHQLGIPAILIQALYLVIERKIQYYRQVNERVNAAIDAVHVFFKENNLSDDLREKCLRVLEEKLAAKRGVEYVYIHPKPGDHPMFFGDHFNLSGRKMADIVRIGFKSAINVLRRYEFEFE